MRQGFIDFILKNKKEALDIIAHCHFTRASFGFDIV